MVITEQMQRDFDWFIGFLKSFNAPYQDLKLRADENEIELVDSQDCVIFTIWLTGGEPLLYKDPFYGATYFYSSGYSYHNPPETLEKEIAEHETFFGCLRKVGLFLLMDAINSYVNNYVEERICRIIEQEERET